MALSRLRITLVIGMATLLALVSGGVFDDLRWPLAIPPIVVGLGALATQGSNAWVRSAGHAVTIVGTTVVAVLSVGGSVADAVPGVLSGPRRLITTEWPSPADPIVIGTIAALLAITTASAAELAARPRFHLAPLVPLTVTFTTLLALGAPVQPVWWLLLALGALAMLIGLARHDAAATSAGRPLVGDRTIAVTGAAVMIAAVATSSTVAWADRADPRVTEDAEVSAAVLDPIEAAVALRQAEPVIPLFDVTDRSTLIGRSLPSRWRMAALEVYDGQRWVPRLTLRPIGGRLGLPSPAVPDRAPPIRYELAFLTDDLDLVPFPGRPLSIDADVETDLDRVVVRLGERPRPGLVLEALSEIAPGAGAARAASVASRQVDEIAGTFSEEALALGGEGDLLEQLQQIEETLRTEWELDPNAPGGGQQLALIERFITDTQRGTREQFVTAFVLLVRSLGYDARVATGFVVPPDELGTPLTITSEQASVWPEVRIEGVGWLAFDPVPPVETTDEDEEPPLPDAQSPAAAQPPIAPPAEEADDTDDTIVDRNADGGRWGSVRTWLVRSATVGGLAMLPFAIVIGAILWMKWRRRRRRLGAGDPALRIRGVWANTTDSLVDAGLVIGPAWTDDRIAGAAVPLAPATPHEMRRLASMSTAMTFGAVTDAWRLVDDAVLTSATVDQAIRAGRTRWQRIKLRLSLRSLRRSTRSPVDV